MPPAAVERTPPLAQLVGCQALHAAARREWLDAAAPDHTRLVIINKNVPGVLGMITTLLGDMGVNIAQQLNTSRDDIAYNVIDMQVSVRVEG